MRPPEVDRFSPDPRGDPAGRLVEVHVSVVDDGRGAIRRGLMYLGLAAGVIAAVVVLLVSTLTSSEGHSRSASLAAPSSRSTAPELSRSGRGMLLLVSHPYLVADARQFASHDSCAGSRSAAVERKIETLYARAVAQATGAVLPGRAKLQATTYPRC